MSATSAASSLLDRLWLCEAVRLREEQAGPLEDSEANRQAVQHASSLQARIEHRARLLGERDGLRQAMQHWRQGAQLAGGLLVLLALFSGGALALAALGKGQQPVNVFWALGSLLGLNLLSLLGWLLGWRLSGDSGGALGRLWLWLSEKLARDAQAVHLAPALLLVLQRRGLLRWGLGVLTNGLWLLAMLASLGLLIAMLSTRRYGFVWETTLLSGDSFVGLTHALGTLPALLGFGMPADAAIRASGAAALADESARQAWASWLIGVMLVYGVLPRLLLSLLCLWRWQRGLDGLSLDLSAPGYQLLRQRLQPPSERLGVCDPAPVGLPRAEAGQTQGENAGAVLVAVELDPQRPWPPAGLKHIADAGILDTREQRRQVLQQLTQFPPARLAIACDPRRSPDRGTLALLGELSRCAGQTRIWLLQAPTGEALDSERLGDWHAALEQLQLPHASTAPLSWLEHGHD